MIDNRSPTDTAIFQRREIELLIDRACAIRVPLTARSWRWVRWSKRVKASEDALYQFHDVAARALHRFDQEKPWWDGMEPPSPESPEGGPKEAHPPLGFYDR